MPGIARDNASPMTDARPHPLTLDLTALAPTGEAIGRAEGLVVFVPYALPGERVEVEIVFRRKGFARARLLRVVQAAAERVSPACPHFTRCGGCDLQHLPYPAQLAFKTGAVREQLRRIGGFAEPPVQPCAPSPRPLRYRNHVQFAVTEDRTLGFFAAGGRRAVSIDDCPITAPEVMALARGTRARAGETLDARAGLTGHGVACHTRDARGAVIASSGDGAVHERLAGIDFAFHPEGFFQVNPFAAATLIDEALRAAQPQPGQRALDVYCGVGTFTLPLARVTGHATGLELEGRALPFARRNAEEAGLSAATHFISGPATVSLRRPEIRDGHWDVILVDPPRAGLEPEALDALLALEAPRLVYVSCDPATLARDLARFVANRYALEHVQPVDLFPQTRHVEAVASLRAAK